MKPTPSGPAPAAPPVPLCDIQAQYRGLKDEIDAAVIRVLSSGQAILGPEVTAFELEAAAFCGAAHGVGCGSGSDALVLALHALDIGPDDEVIVPPFTFFATASAVCRVGAKPVFVDIDPVTYNLDPSQIEAKITPQTRAIIPVHLFGQCCDMDAIWEVAEQNQLYVVEDWVADLGGALAALSPILIGDFRKSFRPERPPSLPSDDASADDDAGKTREADPEDFRAEFSGRRPRTPARADGR